MSSNDNMNAKDAVDFLNSLPKSGVIEIDTSSGGLYIIASTASYSVHGGCIRIEGETGYGNIATVDSIILIDPDTINHIRHTRGTNS